MILNLSEQSRLFPESTERRWTDYALERSLRQIGPTSPALVWDKKIFDGRRKLDICERLGIKLPYLNVEDRWDAARRLYLVHPRRAFLAFAHEGIWRHDLANLFGVSAHELPSSHQLRDAKRTKGRGARCTEEKAVIGGISIERYKLEVAKELCQAQGISFSAWVRGQIEDLIATHSEGTEEEPLSE